MEFRFRAVDVDRPPLVPAPSNPPNPNFSFISARPVSALIEDHAREALQRQIEKEQIRQQIIVAETARRREVLAEVVHEMAIEREMAIRRVAETRGASLEENLSMWINPKMRNNFSTPPMMPEATATSTLESNKDKLILLNRTDPTTAEILQVEDTQTALERAKRKAVGVERVSNEHSQRKRLRSKARAAEMKRVSVQTGHTASSMLPGVSEFGSGKQVESKVKSKYKFWCEDCGVGAYSETVMRDHKLGKKHKAVTSLPHNITTKITTSSPSNVPHSEVIRVHETANVQNQKVDEMAEKDSGKKTEGDKKKPVMIWCETCNIQTNSEQMMEAHRLGKKHKALHEKHHNRPPAV